MTIKDVEKVTGLTIKSIRYYEEKGLIEVKRNKDNDYRNYTDNDIQNLKLIKILRYLNFSIEEISHIIEEDSLYEALKEKIKKLEEESNNCLEKQTICESLMKDCTNNELDSIINEYSDTINFLESEEGKRTKSEFMELICPNLSAIIINSFVFLGPILWLFINIHDKNWDAMLLNSICAIICTIFLVIEWVYYISNRKKHKEIIKQNNKNNSLNIPTGIVTLIISIGFMLLTVFCADLLAPNNYLFMNVNDVLFKFLLGFIMLFIIIFITSILKKLKINRTEELDDYLWFWDKLKYVLTIIFLVILYCFITTITYVAEDKIIYRDPLHPFGIKYEYSDITKIETGFGRKNFAFIEYNKKGEFYYRIYMGNKKITFTGGMTNPKIDRYEEDTYLELEEFDNNLKKYNIKKIVDNEYSKNCNLDKEYCDRFKRIANNDK